MLSKLTAIFASAVIVATAVFWLVTELDQRNRPTIEISAPRNGEPIVVEIAGAVEAPGVYELPDRSRVDDLINAAGGLLPDADASALNRASRLIDGQRVTIPSSNPAGEEPLALSASPGAIELLDLNRATVAQLVALPEIGETRAQAIVAFRNANGPFTSIEQLLLVEGISESVLDAIRTYITINQ